MKKPVSSSNLALRFYKAYGWEREILETYLISGEILDTETSHHKDPPEDAYFILAPGSKLDMENLYKNEVSDVIRTFNDKPYQSDLEFMEDKNW